MSKSQIDSLLKQLGEVLSEATDELANLSTPEEGFFFAVELQNTVFEKIALRYDAAEPKVAATLRSLAKMNSETIILKQRATLEALSLLRAKKLEDAILTRLEDVEVKEEVDLSAVKARISDVVSAFTANHGMDFLELGVKAQIL